MTDLRALAERAEPFLCQDCNRPYETWYTPLPHWNAVMGHPQAGFLCASCFLVRAYAVGEAAGIWHLVTQDEWEKSAALFDERGRLRKAMEKHARFDEEMDPCDGNPCPLRTALDHGAER